MLKAAYTIYFLYSAAESEEKKTFILDSGIWDLNPCLLCNGAGA